MYIYCLNNQLKILNPSEESCTKKKHLSNTTQIFNGIQALISAYTTLLFTKYVDKSSIPIFHYVIHVYSLPKMALTNLKLS